MSHLAVASVLDVPFHSCLPGKPCELGTLLHVLMEAYKKTVMNKSKFAMKDMENLLESPTLRSAREDVKRLKELDRQPVKTKGGT